MKVDIYKSFRELNPLMTLSPFINKLYQDRPEIADKVMWSLFLIDYPDPEVNPKANSPIDQRIYDVSKTYYEIDLTDSFIEKVREEFLIHCLSFEEQMYKIQKQKIDEITSHFNKLDLANKDDRDEYLAISKILPGIWANFDKIKKLYIEDKNKSGSVKGNTNLSKSESLREKRANKKE